MKIAVLGTGRVGSTLGRRWAALGHEIVFGTRNPVGPTIAPLLELAALLSINLGIMNLLPLPMLDGGRIFFLLIEVVRGGRRIAPEREALVHMIGFAAFIALAIVVTFADVSRILGGGGAP